MKTMKTLLSAFLLLVVLTTAGFAKEIDGSKEPDKVPDRVALRLFLKSVAFILESENPEVQNSIQGLFDIFHFTAEEAEELKVVALQLYSAEKKAESDHRDGKDVKAQRKAALDLAFGRLGGKTAFKEALKDIKRGVKLNDSEVND